jgi:hypothetical protein
MKKMAKILLLAAVTILGRDLLNAQQSASETDLRYRLLYDTDSDMLVDSLQPVRRQRLVPENVSFMEKGLWSEG